jgi:magnesium-transporting ATPase (P-type)
VSEDRIEEHVIEEETGDVQTSTSSSVVWRWTAMAATFSLVVNITIYFIGVAAGWIPEDMPASTEAFSLVSVALLSVIPVFLFGALMVFLANKAPRASRLFAIILLVVLILSVLLPFLLRDIEPSFRFTLIAMHIVTTGSIFVLTRIPQN